MTRVEHPEPPLELLEELRRRPVPEESRAADEARRRMAVAATVRTMARETRRHRRLHWLARSAAAAAAVCLMGLGWREFEVRRPTRSHADSSDAVAKAPAELRVTAGVVVATQPGHEEAVSAGARVAVLEGEEIRTAPDGRGLLALPRGVSMELGFATQAWVDTARTVEQRIRLDIGSVRVSVPNPGGPRMVAITTPDAQVIVHGTKFSVRVEPAEPAPGTITSVVVTRGSVLIVHGGEQQLIAAGNSWSSIAAKPADSTEAASAVVPGFERAKDGAELPHSVSRRPTRRGALASQNRLFQAALDARKAGDDVEVLRNLDELLARFPGTALEPDVRLNKIRALKRLGRLEEASREAEQYLKAYPDGPAQDEVRRILLQSSGATSPR